MKVWLVVVALLASVRAAGAEAWQGLGVTSEDEAFAVRLRLRMQTRAELADDEITAQVRRLRLVLEGNAYGARNRFYLQLGLSPRDQLGGLAVEDGSVRRSIVRDARIERRQHRDLELIIGQTKIPFSRQRLASSGELQLPDRAITNEEFNLDRDVGVVARSRALFGRPLGYAIGVFTGRGRNAFEAQPLDLLYVARVELGTHGYLENELARPARPRGQLGAAYAFQHGAIADRGVFGELFEDGQRTGVHHATLDGALRYRGLSAQAALHLRRRTSETVPLRSGLGAMVQLGLLAPEAPLELALRYAVVHPLGDSPLEGRAEHGVGASWYFADHGYKLQAYYARITSASSPSIDLVQLQLQLAL